MSAGICSACQGTGDGDFVEGEGTMACTACGGSGAVPNAASLAVTAIEAYSDRLALACRAEMELEDERPIVKADAVRRIMARDSIAATPAEKIVETDAEYAAHRRRQYDAVVEKQRAFGAYEAAKRRADVAIDLGLLLSRSGDYIEPKVGEIAYDGDQIVAALVATLNRQRERTFGGNGPLSAALDWVGS